MFASDKSIIHALLGAFVRSNESHRVGYLSAGRGRWEGIQQARGGATLMRNIANATETDAQARPATGAAKVRRLRSVQAGQRSARRWRRLRDVVQFLFSRRCGCTAVPVQ